MMVQSPSHSRSPVDRKRGGRLRASRPRRSDSRTRYVAVSFHHKTHRSDPWVAPTMFQRYKPDIGEANEFPVCHVRFLSCRRPSLGKHCLVVGYLSRRDPYSHETRLERYNPESRLGPTHHVSTFKWVLGGHLHKVPQHLLATQAGRVKNITTPKVAGRSNVLVVPAEREPPRNRHSFHPSPGPCSFSIQPRHNPSKTRHQMHIVQRSWRRQDQIP
jgi:hypothetical protein